MKLKLYLNRDGAAGVSDLPETVKPGDVVPSVCICPIGDWPHGECMQHVTENAVKAMVESYENDGRKEILVDFDHDAEDGKSTVAAAWISNLRLEKVGGESRSTDDGKTPLSTSTSSLLSLVGDFKLTDAGADALANRRFRFLSPCWEVNVDRWTNGGEKAKGDDDYPAEVTPVRLVSVALTNKPNIPMAPVLNREPEGDKSVQQNEGNIMDPAKIKEALGLAPDATEDDILAALGKMKAENEECCREREEAKKAAAEKEADDFAEANAKKCNKEVVKAQYLANKEATIALVNAMPDATERVPPVCNRADAKTPTISNAADTDAKVLATYENMTPGKAKDEFLMANAVAINRARNAKM